MFNPKQLLPIPILAYSWKNINFNSFIGDSFLLLFSPISSAVSLNLEQHGTDDDDDVVQNVTLSKCVIYFYTQRAGFGALKFCFQVN